MIFVYLSLGVLITFQAMAADERSENAYKKCLAMKQDLIKRGWSEQNFKCENFKPNSFASTQQQEETVSHVNEAVTQLLESADKSSDTCSLADNRLAYKAQEWIEAQTYIVPEKEALDSDHSNEAPFKKLSKLKGALRKLKAKCFG